MPQATSYFDREVETLPRASLEALALDKLNRLVAEVGARNEFYRRAWKRHGIADPPSFRSLGDLRRLPHTTKEELVADQREHPPFGSGLTYPLDRYVKLHQTSGTTGHPLRWLDTADSWAWWIRCWSFVYGGAGVGPEDRLMFAFSFGPFVGFWSGFEAAASVGAVAIPGGGQDSALRLKTLDDTGATVLVCTPSYALHLARVARDQGLDPAKTSVRKTIHAGEPGASIPGTRQQIEEAWGATCFDHYGLTEVGAVGFQCGADPQAMHVNESEFVFEVRDPASGEVSADGEGELVVTNLGRQGSPLFRYRTGDLVRLVREPCLCGRSFARLEGGVRGRVDDMLVVRGVNVFPGAIENVVRRHPLVDEFRIEVSKRNEMDQVRVLLDLGEGPSAPEAEREAAAVSRELRSSLGIRVDVDKAPPGSLPRAEMKAKRLVRVEADRGMASGEEAAPEPGSSPVDAEWHREPALSGQPSEGFFLVDGSRRVVGWSPGIERILGIPGAEALGEPCFQLMRRFGTRDPLPCTPDCDPLKSAARGEIPVCVLRRDHGLGAWSLRHELIASPDGDLVLHRLRDASLDVISIRFLRRVLEALEEDVGELRQVRETAYADNLALTRREVVVLQHLAEGLDTRTIAKRLDISYYTARNYIQNLMTKLNAHNRVEAVVSAQRLGLLRENGWSRSSRLS